MLIKICRSVEFGHVNDTLKFCLHSPRSLVQVNDWLKTDKKSHNSQTRTLTGVVCTVTVWKKYQKSHKIGHVCAEG